MFQFFLRLEINITLYDWLINNPGKVISIYHVTESIGKMYCSSVITLNIISGFKKTCIYPLTLTHLHFLTLFVTDCSVHNDKYVRHFLIETSKILSSSSAVKKNNLRIYDLGSFHGNVNLRDKK